MRSAERVCHTMLFQVMCSCCIALVITGYIHILDTDALLNVFYLCRLIAPDKGEDNTEREMISRTSTDMLAHSPILPLIITTDIVK